MRRCKCGKQLHRQTRGDQCRPCSTTHSLRAGAREPEVFYLVDVPRMTDDEYQLIMDVDNDNEPPIVPTDAADRIVQRIWAAVRAAKDRHGILDH